MDPLIADDVVVNGLKIHYYRTGKTPEHAWPILVMLHGITDSGLCWPRVVKALSEDYAMVLPDARGHGLSDKPETGYSAAHHASDVAGLIRALGLERPVLIGHSMGGSQASTAAARYPELISGVILEDPGWFSAEDMGTAAQRAERAAWWRKNIVEEQAMTPKQLIAKRKAQKPDWDDEEFTDWVFAKFQVTPNVARFDADVPVAWQEIAKAIQCPALLLTADVAKGALVTPEMAAEAQQINPNIQVVHFPSAGHNIRREDFDAYLSAVRSFLATLLR